MLLGRQTDCWSTWRQMPTLETASFDSVSLELLRGGTPEFQSLPQHPEKREVCDAACYQRERGGHLFAACRHSLTGRS